MHLNGQYVYASLAEIDGELYAVKILLDDGKNDSRAHFKDITLKKIEDALYVSSGEQVAGSLPAASSTKDAMPSSSGDSARFLNASLSDDGNPSAALAAKAVEVGPPGTSPSSSINIKRLAEIVNPEIDGNQENTDIRHSVSGFTEAERRDIITLLKPFVGMEFTRPGRSLRPAAFSANLI